ncbi:MAG: hypothetical protein U0746_03120 [Gemmataceae bacterium]
MPTGEQLEPKRPSYATRAVQAAPEPQAQDARKKKLTVHLDADLCERVKNAAYWNPRLTIASIAELGISQVIDQVEAEHGGPYPQREGNLVGGRPMK